MRLAAFALSFVPALALAADIVVQHQGRILDNTDVPLTGSHQLTISMYAGKEAPTPVWSESYTVAVFEGVYALGLGDTYGVENKKPLAAADVDGERWLGVKLDGGAEFQPRLRMGAVPAAVRASVAATVDPDGVGTPQLKDASVTLAMLLGPRRP